MSFAINFAAFADRFGKKITDINFIQTFIFLLNDNEAEALHTSINNISDFLTDLSTEKICRFMLQTFQNAYANQNKCSKLELPCLFVK